MLCWVCRNEQVGELGILSQNFKPIPRRLGNWLIQRPISLCLLKCLEMLSWVWTSGAFPHIIKEILHFLSAFPEIWWSYWQKAKSKSRLCAFYNLKKHLLVLDPYCSLGLRRCNKFSVEILMPFEFIVKDTRRNWLFIWLWKKIAYKKTIKLLHLSFKFPNILWCPWAGICSLSVGLLYMFVPLKQIQGSVLSHTVGGKLQEVGLLF